LKSSESPWHSHCWVHCPDGVGAIGAVIGAGTGTGTGTGIGTGIGAVTGTGTGTGGDIGAFGTQFGWLLIQITSLSLGQ